ncbi:MAG: hypothetical protein HC783_09630 [Rhodobacteraceae bacterium]|nr:hypothetical protein [Paracoccaceae bacterium]
MAVFVLFQPKGIAGSTFLTLDHLTQEGWSTLVISNAPLSEADRTRLAAASGHVIERPNTGYDFGAYREGWRWLHRRGLALDRLILMNDSTWFPLRMNDTSLKRMEALNADLAGQIYKTEKTEAKGRDHLESHLLMLSGRALSHPAIQRFWAAYVMTKYKPRTILFGEKGLSQAAMTANLSVAGLLGREQMVDLLSNLSDADLLEALDHLALHNEPARLQRTAWKGAASVGQPWRESFLAWTSQELSNSRQHLVSATYVASASRYGDMGFLKKSNERRFHLARLAFLRGIEEGYLSSINTTVMLEVQASTSSWKPQEHWRLDPDEQMRPVGL